MGEVTKQYKCRSHHKRRSVLDSIDNDNIYTAEVTVEKQASLKEIVNLLSYDS